MTDDKSQGFVYIEERDDLTEAEAEALYKLTSEEFCKILSGTVFVIRGER